MKKLNFFLGKSLVIFMMIIINVQAQNMPGVKRYSFQNTYGAGEARVILKDSTNNLFVAGEIGGFVSLMKIDSSGNIIWSRKYINGSDLNSFKIIPGKGFILTGATYSNCALFVIKADTLGNFVSGRVFKNLGFVVGFGDIDITNDGGFVFVNSVSLNSSSVGIVVSKLDSNLNIVWFKSITSWHYGFSIKAVADGIMIAGNYGNFQTSSDEILLIKLDLGGNLIWAKYYGLTFGDTGESTRSLIQTRDSCFIVCGISSSEEERNIFIIKTNKYGDTLWTKSIGFLDNIRENALSVIETDDAYLFSGSIAHLPQNTMNNCIFALTKSGNILWDKKIGNSDLYFVTGLYSMVDFGSNYFTAGIFQEQFYVGKTAIDSSCNEVPIGMGIIPHQVTVGLPVLTLSLLYPTVDTIISTTNNSTPLLFTVCAVDSIPIDTTHVDTTYIKEISKNNTLIYPNPAKDYINIINAGGKVLFVYNSIGEQVFSKRITEENENLNFNLNPGIYLYKIGNSQIKKLIVLK